MNKRSRIKTPFFVTALSVVVSLLVTSVMMNTLMDRPDRVGYLIAFIVPLFIAFPVSYYIQGKRLEFADMHDELHLAHETLKHISQFDDLTQTYNRATFYQLVRKSEEASASKALLMVDVDHFKQINDCHGHKAGDEALVLIVNAMKSVLRKRDIVGRMGGEEFCIYCPGIAREQSLRVAERIREAVAAVDFEPSPEIVHRLSVSIGVVSVDAKFDMDGFDQLVQAADHYMYQAKENGRDRVMGGSL
ncbi:diguanylate cyclase (GGDEF) domain-containing protein [Cohaesibacter gelatinilyticus]|uniref:diguanylate cyclase n=2 Tax=Cohaesibacter gelatinilyticus TaxID=372072 RepID=A0A285PIE1_9HYPH|nr:diguanylate cyclase (GGDEF) domain-containing protein [Cohaesibacter gelatinilyticus]